ncbi:response regulator transcription factor [Micrococcus sp. EYE_162]|uniref:response regulator n=1 Tax=unclassified Micrococcus TaxID=2620948 RepID=UPI0020038024|nr:MULTISPECIES: response regulator transcription factor [unclassified Micrococcus]MCK6095043.1 response regulator transcription factor [Micrococcus sp. EYE_212]MCK6170990.1 response regulator transcription factor [Micrococcus sp. EYE_162]
MTLRVLLVDDQPLIRVGFTAILRSQPDLEVVGEAGDGEDALRLAAETDPDVICMDVQMPRLDGVEATRRLVAGGTRAAVPILTTFDTDEALFAALTAGAAGFLLKSAGPEELIEAVRVLGRGDALLDPQVTRRVLQRMTAGAGAAPPPADAAPAAPAPADPLPAEPARGVGSGAGAGDGVGLTAREAEVLRAMARGLSNGEIARELFVGEATVKTHVSNVLLKTGARDRVHAVIWAFEHGVAG